MTSAGNVVAFLSPASPAFDPSLMLVMAGAIAAAIIPFQTAAGWHKARKAGVVSQVHFPGSGKTQNPLISCCCQLNWSGACYFGWSSCLGTCSGGPACRPAHDCGRHYCGRPQTLHAATAFAAARQQYWRQLPHSLWWSRCIVCVRPRASATPNAHMPGAQTRPKPPSGAIDGRLVAGAALFGAGWGLTGLCPGPALANLARPSAQIIVAVGAMLGGMWTVQRCV